MHLGKHAYKSFIFILVLALSIKCPFADQLDNFSSDGCSQFPDGTLFDQNLWCNCCIEHDIAYWQGGTQQQKKQADHALRDCVFNKTHNKLLANIMYLGVTVGGLPIFPTWYRWGYGWRYGRGFQSLNHFEKQAVNTKLQDYLLSTTHSSGFCHFEHPITAKIKQTIQQLIVKLQHIE